jgi:FMN phosphatase YigB (HAD superfamily)
MDKMFRRLAPLLLVASAHALAPPPQLRLLTCDLDDTFWPTAEVVAAANAALYEALEAHGADASLLGATMKKLRRAAGVQMSYTEARTSAISELLGGDHGTAEELFQLWLDARQRASEDLLFPDAATSLAEVRRRHPDAVVGAVTNGRGDPRHIPSLAPFFDFCVSGEDADVHPQRKPAPRIYEAALERAHCGPDGWVHLGDDVLNDCSAAKTCGARTVWLDAAAPSWQENAYSTMSAADREKRRLAAEAVDVAVAVDRTIGGLAELPDAVDGALS